MFTSLLYHNFSNFGSLKSTETPDIPRLDRRRHHFSNFGSLKSTETPTRFAVPLGVDQNFSNFGSLKSTETDDPESGIFFCDAISAISAR